MVEIKSEAVKWVKEMKVLGKYYAFAGKQFMDFFNITEEDLK